MLDQFDELGPEYKTAIYARSSTQNENLSTDMQINNAMKVLEEEKLILYKVYEDKKTSATDKPFRERGEFKHLMRDAEAGKFKNIIVYRRDRLARNVEELMEIQRIFRKLGIKVIYTHDTNLKGMAPEYRDFVENILAAVSELEPGTIRERIKAGKKNKKLKGLYSHGKHMPYGYKKDKKGNYVPVSKETKETIQKLFEAYIKDNSKENNRLLKELKEKYKSQNCDIEEKTSEPNILSMVKNPVYAGLEYIKSKKNLLDLFTQDKETGEFYINDDLLVDAKNVIPIVDKETWEKAILKWRKNYKEKSKGTEEENVNIFKGLLYCKKCGKNLNPGGPGSKYYRCKESKCTSIKEEDVFQKVLNRIIEDIMTSDIAQKVIKKEMERIQRKEINSLEKKLKTLRNKQDKALSKFLKNSENDKAKKDLKALIEEEETLREEIRKLDKKVQSLKDRLENIDDFIELFKYLGSAKRIANYFKKNSVEAHEILSQLIGKVVLGSENGECKVKDFGYSNFREEAKPRKSKQKGKQ